MTYQVLARKWRPHNFTEVVGQEHVVKSLINALQHDRLHHAYLFTGTRGVGKTTLARILAKAVNCDRLQDFNPCGECDVCRSIDEGRFLDLIEIDAASRTKVEDTRDLLDNVQYAPNQGRYKVYLIDEVHMLSGHSFNALLKTLEEPPPHVKFLLATTDPHKIPVTVLSRCLQFNLKKLLPGQILKQMEHILVQEGIEFETSALKELARAADGSMRDALSLLDQAIVFGSGKVAEDEVYAMLGTVARQPVYELLSALADQSGAAILGRIDELANLSSDFSGVLRQVLQVLHRIALLQQVPGVIDPDMDADRVNILASNISPEDIQLYYQIALIGQRDLDLAPDPRSGFEMVMLRMLAFRPETAKRTPHRATAMADAVQPGESACPPPGQSRPTRSPAMGRISAGADAANDRWPEMIDAMKLSALTRELASNCVLESIDDKACRLILDAGHEHLRRPGSVQNLQKALQTFSGKPLKLVIDIQKTTVATPALLQITEREERQQAAVDAINSDDNILALKEHFDARIMPDTIEPV
ncbi:MAG: DNA polymerase III subunit gamma/tau [Gammaproteobacteria bacterium]